MQLAQIETRGRDRQVRRLREACEARERACANIALFSLSRAAELPRKALQIFGASGSEPEHVGASVNLEPEVCENLITIIRNVSYCTVRRIECRKRQYDLVRSYSTTNRRTVEYD